MSVLLRMLGYVHPTRMLNNISSTKSLLLLDFVTNHELMLESQSDEHWAYFFFDPLRGAYVRAGMASNQSGHKNMKGNEKGRHNSQLAASMKKSVSMFYMFYPNELSPYKTNLAHGVFQDLELIGALRFRDEHKRKVQDFFRWGVHVLKFLERRKPKGCVSFEDKNTGFCVTCLKPRCKCVSIPLIIFWKIQDVRHSAKCGMLQVNEEGTVIIVIVVDLVHFAC